jgi:hypothetical protein
VALGIAVRGAIDPRDVHDAPTGAALALKMQPTTPPFSSTSTSSSLHSPDGREADARLRLSWIIPILWTGKAGCSWPFTPLAFSSAVIQNTVVIVPPEKATGQTAVFFLVDYEFVVGKALAYVYENQILAALIVSLMVGVGCAYRQEQRSDTS